MALKALVDVQGRLRSGWAIDSLLDLVIDRWSRRAFQRHP
jgi:hypothetical protein